MEVRVGRMMLIGVLAGSFTLVGCQSGPKDADGLEAPTTARSPYAFGQTSAIWAIAPLRNESGTSACDPLEISDKVAQAVGQVRGLRALPLNRTLEAMRALEMAAVNSPEDALKLASELGADGIVVGSITAYDPYNPPTIGLNLVLIGRPGRLERKDSKPMDPMELRYQSQGSKVAATTAWPTNRLSTISVVLDGKNNQVLGDLRTYAMGRSEGRSALGWRRFLASIDFYAEFAAWHSVSTLIEEEWLRLARPGP
jgi:hypothetical protein